MVFEPMRTRQWVISLIGSLIVLPVYLSWGGIFSFSYTVFDSIWAWGFGLVACWLQVIAIMFSFFHPRKGAYWLLLNAAISMLLAIGEFSTSTQFPGTIEVWPHTISGLVKAAIIFWMPPILLAALLLRCNPHNRSEVLTLKLR